MPPKQLPLYNPEQVYFTEALLILEIFNTQSGCFGGWSGKIRSTGKQRICSIQGRHTHLICASSPCFWLLLQDVGEACSSPPLSPPGSQSFWLWSLSTMASSPGTRYCRFSFILLCLMLFISHLGSMMQIWYAPLSRNRLLRHSDFLFANYEVVFQFENFLLDLLQPSCMISCYSSRL